MRVGEDPVNKIAIEGGSTSPKTMPVNRPRR